METARQFWRPIINDFNPVGVVRPEEVAKFFVHRYASDPTRSLVQRLQLNLQNSLGQPNPYKALLTGHVGSGKGSELIRLGQELVADFFVVWFDAEMSLATEKATHFDVLLGMGLAVHVATEAAGLRPDKRLARNLVNSLARLVRKYEERGGFALRLDQLLDQVFAIALVAGAVGGAPAHYWSGQLSSEPEYIRCSRPCASSSTCAMTWCVFWNYQRTGWRSLGR